MSSISAEIRLRPTRIGFLVDPTDTASVRLCMNLCSGLWGGLYNPIIPVCREIPEAWSSGLYRGMTGDELAKGYIRFFEPDVFVESTPGLAAGLGIKGVELRLGHKRVLPLADMLGGGADTGAWPPAGMSVLPVYQTLYDKEFKFVTRQNHLVAYCKAANSIDEAFVDAAYGAFPESESLPQLARGYQDAFAPKPLRATAKNWEKALREGYRFPLSMGRHGLERLGIGGRLDGPTLFVADPASSLDLIDLWNIRLFQPNVVPVNSRWFAACAPFLREFISANHRPLPGNSHGVMIMTSVEFGRSIGEKRATALIKAAELDKLPGRSWSFKLWYDRIWEERQDDFVMRPKRARITAKSENLDLPIAEGPNERSVRFRGLSPDFAPQYPAGSIAWVNVLQFRSFGAHSELALSLPVDYEPVSTYRIRTGNVILPSREGMVLPQRYKDLTEYFSLRTGRETLTEWLKQHGLTASISKAGRVAEQVIGAVKGIHGSNLLAHRETIMLLDKMAKSIRRYQDGMEEEYQDRTVAATAWSSLMAKRAKDAWFSNLTLDEFVERNILKLGLAIQCSHCSNTNWYGISELGESVVCDRCRKTYAFPQGSIGFAQTPWKFRVVGPFSVPDFAEGAYATVLTLRVFAQSLSGMPASLVYAPGLNLKTEDGSHLEVDFALWHSGESMGFEEAETVTVFGESKSFGAKTSPGCARLRRGFPAPFSCFQP
jgi:hypothetical protein